MKKSKEKKNIFLWCSLVTLMTICVYCSLPNVKIQPDVHSLNEVVQEKKDEAEVASSEIEDMIEAYFKGRPVRDVPENADFASFLKGSYAKKNKDYLEGATSYEKVLKTDPENKEIQSSLYLYFVLAGDVEKAEIYAKKALELNENEVLAQVVMLTSQIKKKKYDEALESIERLGPVYSGFLTPISKAWILAAKGDVEGGMDSLENINKKGLSGLYLLHKGTFLDFFGKKKEASVAYNELVNMKESKNIRVLMLLKEFETRTHLITDKKILNDNYAAIEEESFISKEMMSQNGNEEVVKSPAQGMSWALFDVATALISSRDLKAALSFAQMAHYLNPQSSVITLFLGEILESMNVMPQANRLYETVTKKQNIYLSSRMRIALNLVKAKRLDEAEQRMSALVKNYPNIPLFYMTLADIYRENKNYEKALETYNTALKFVAKKDKQVAPIYFSQGLCYDAMEKTDEAIALFEKALQLDAQNPIYLNYVGYLWLEENKNLPEALQLIKKAVSYAPNDGNILDSLGRAYFLLENYDQALKFLEKAVSLEAGNAVINSHLGDVYWKLKRYREARFQWSHASTLKQASSEKLLAELSQKMKDGLAK